MHLPQATVLEALTFSATLRLPSTVPRQTRDDFIEEVSGHPPRQAPLSAEVCALVCLPALSPRSSQALRALHCLLARLAPHPTTLTPRRHPTHPLHPAHRSWR